MTTMQDDAVESPSDRLRSPASIAVVIAAIAVVVLAAVGAVAVFFTSRSNASVAAAKATTASSAAETSTVLEIARQDAVDFTSYDYRHLAADFARFRRQATGTVQHQYAMSTEVLAGEFRKTKVRAVGQAISSGLMSIGPDTASVVVAVNDSVSNTNLPSGQTVYDRLFFELAKVNGKWLVSQVHEV